MDPLNSHQHVTPEEVKVIGWLGFGVFMGAGVTALGVVVYGRIVGEPREKEVDLLLWSVVVISLSLLFPAGRLLLRRLWGAIYLRTGGRRRSGGS